jgi:hypothetical protein
MRNLVCDHWTHTYKTCLTILIFYPTSSFCVKSMGVWQGVAMDSLKFHLGLPCPTLLRPVGRPPLKQSYHHCRDGLFAGWVACGCPLTFFTPRYSYRIVRILQLCGCQDPPSVLSAQHMYKLIFHENENICITMAKQKWDWVMFFVMLYNIISQIWMGNQKRMFKILRPLLHYCFGSNKTLLSPTFFAQIFSSWCGDEVFIVSS